MSTVRPYDWFSELYDSIYASLVDYSADVDFLLAQYSKISGLPSPETVLDIGCGTGSHLVEFARRGMDVIGVDASMVAVEKARLKFAGRGRAMRQDMRMLDVGDKIDLAISMFTSIGYLQDDSDIILVLSRLARRMGRSGVLCLELWQSGCIDDGCEATIDVPYHVTGCIHRLSRFEVLDHRSVNLSFEFTIKDLARGIDVVVQEDHRIRTFSLDEVRALLDRAGIYVGAVVKGGSFQQITRQDMPAGVDDFRIIVVGVPSTKELH